MAKYFRWIDFVPLAGFVWGAHFLGIHSIESSYYLGAGLACAQILFLRLRSMPIDYMALGVDLFLVYGAIGYLVNKEFLLPYALFKEPILFVWVFLIGLYATMLLPNGFIGVPFPGSLIKKPALDRVFISFILLCLTAVALFLSYFLVNFVRVDLGFGLFLPFMCLMGAREGVRNYFYKLPKKRPISK